MAIGNLPTANEEDFRRAHHWQFPEISCVTSGALSPSGMIQCLSAVPSGVRLRLRELTIRNSAPRAVVVHVGVSAAPWSISGLSPRKLSIDVPAQTTRVWSSQDGRVFTPGQRVCFHVTPTCFTPEAIFITGAGLEE